ncbi:MAG: DUF2007 domain-containing protein [Gammaproteobacteria bacterium]|nr:DUF2007 domain-containing protein [Gammaproteobacteria bacterium]
MKRILRSDNRFQLALLRDMLRDNHVACVIKNELLAGAAGELPPTECWPELWVLDDYQYDKALELVRAYSQAPEAAPGPWVCPSCQEQLDGVFTQCWRCGYERPNWELFDAEPPPST